MGSKKLISISKYANKYKISRTTVYRLIDLNKLTRYESPDGEPMLDGSESPSGLQKYAGKRERRKR